jgi:RNA polymerase sigma-70 factor (ECF subfamily)
MPTGLAERTDDELVALCRRGEERAFRELYARYRQRIMNFAFRMVRDHDAAADILQETFEYLFRKIPRYRPEGKLPILLYRAARNISLNRLRRSRRAREMPLEEEAIVQEGGESGGKLEAQEVRERISAAIAELPQIYSEVIILRILKGMPVSEVARIVQCPEGTVKSRLHNGLEMLRKTLRQSGLG